MSKSADTAAREVADKVADKLTDRQVMYFASGEVWLKAILTGEPDGILSDLEWLTAEEYERETAKD